MIYFIALLPATVLTIAGYFVLFLAHRSEGTFRTFGKYLGFWAFTLAGLVVLGAIFAAAHHGRHYPMMYGRMHGRGNELGEMRDGAAPEAPAGGANPAAPPSPPPPAPSH